MSSTASEVWKKPNFPTDKFLPRLSGFRKHDAKLLNSNYRNWRQHAPFLTDFFSTSVSPHPSRTVDIFKGVEYRREWLEDVAIDENKGIEYDVVRAIVGTLNPIDQLSKSLAISEDEILHSLFLLDIKIPIANGALFDRKKPADHGLLTGGLGSESKIEITNYVPIGDEILKARHCPFLPKVVAVRTTSNSDILLYDLDGENVKKEYELYESDLKERAPVFEVSCNVCCNLGNKLKLPQRLKGFSTTGGHGMEWNPNLPGILLAGSSSEFSVCLWDIQSPHDEVAAITKYQSHTAAIQDVSWATINPSVFTSVDDGGIICVADLRSKDSQISAKIHSEPINAIAHAPNPNVFTYVTGTVEGNLALWDMRNVKQRIHSLGGVHTEDITTISFSPHNSMMFASASHDQRLAVFDIGNIGNEKGVNQPEHDNLPPEVLLVFGGHSACVNDFAWSSDFERMIVSVADDNCIQVWEMAQRLYEANASRQKRAPLTDIAEDAPAVGKEAYYSGDDIIVPELPEVDEDVSKPENRFQRETVFHDAKEFRFDFSPSQSANTTRANSPGS